MAQPMYKMIEEYVKNLIDSGKLSQGDLIPSENQLCEEFNVTRMTVRSALTNLVNDGYITRRRGIGSIVLGRKIYDNISSVSGFTQEMEAKNKEVSNILIDLKVVEADEELAKNLNLNLGENVWEIGRVRLADQKRVSYMITYMPVKIFPNLTRKDCEGSLYKFIEEGCGHKIAMSEREVEAIISTEELEKQLDLSKKEPILYIKQRSRFENEEIFEYSHTYHYGYTLTLNAVSK